MIPSNVATAILFHVNTNNIYWSINPVINCISRIDSISRLLNDVLIHNFPLCQVWFRRKPKCINHILLQMQRIKQILKLFMSNYDCYSTYLLDVVFFIENKPPMTNLVLFRAHVDIPCSNVWIFNMWSITTKIDKIIDYLQISWSFEYYIWTIQSIHFGSMNQNIRIQSQQRGEMIIVLLTKLVSSLSMLPHRQ